MKIITVISCYTSKSISLHVWYTGRPTWYSQEVYICGRAGSSSDYVSLPSSSAPLPFSLPIPSPSYPLLLGSTRLLPFPSNPSLPPYLYYILSPPFRLEVGHWNPDIGWRALSTPRVYGRAQPKSNLVYFSFKYAIWWQATLPVYNMQLRNVCMAICIVCPANSLLQFWNCFDFSFVSVSFHLCGQL